MSAGEWFVIRGEGDHAGYPHLAGWMGSAIKGEATGPRDDGWLSYGTCPRCFAMVCTEKRPAYGDMSWAHERWHALTDWPIPPDVMAQIPDPAVRQRYHPQGLNISYGSQA